MYLTNLEFIYFAKSMEDMRKKWLESEERCRELEDQLKIEKSMCQRKINELKWVILWNLLSCKQKKRSSNKIWFHRIDIETHYEKRLQAESKSERLEMELNKMQDQFMMFSKILNDKQFDNEERLNMIHNVHNNQQQTYGQHHRHQPSYEQDNNCSRRLSRAIEDTGSIISDYTEDDIDMPDGDEDHYQEHNQNIHLPVVPSTASLPNTTQNQHRRSIGTKRNQRGQSASLTRDGEKREKKRTRTRSNDVSPIFTLIAFTSFKKNGLIIENFPNLPYIFHHLI